MRLTASDSSAIIAATGNTPDIPLSFAIALGRHLCIAKADPTDDTNQEGCALTMAVLAAGRVPTSGPDSIFNAWHHAATVWPWIKFGQKDCPACVLSELDTEDCITHIFDAHVMKDGKLTLDQLIDWVRSIEPKAAVAA